MGASSSRAKANRTSPIATGNPAPVFKRVGDTPLVATINKEGIFAGQGHNSGRPDTFAKVITLVEQHKAHGCPYPGNLRTEPVRRNRLSPDSLA